MKRFLPLLLILCSGCAALTPEQKKWAGFALGAIAVGAIAAHEADNGKPLATPLAIRDPGAPCTMQPNGTCR